MAEGSIHEQAMLLTAVLATAGNKSLGAGVAALLAYPEPPSKAQVDADHPLGSGTRDSIDTILDLNELIGAYVKHGALSPELVHDVVWVSGVWRVAERFVRDYRAETGEAGLYENFEALARG